MNIALGQVIKSLRQERGITQEQLANHFRLTSQAISKWENGASYPDITLLPELAIFFGVSIDDLFSINNDDHLARIDNMLENEYLISPENFKYAERILNGMLADTPKDTSVLKRKSRLYLHRANRDTLAAGRFAEEGLEASPFDKELHDIYKNARVKRPDFDRRIFYYEKFVEVFPIWNQGFLYLIEAYLQAGKIKQAREAIDKAKKLEQSAELALLEGDAHFMSGDKEQASKIWEATVLQCGSDRSILEQAGDRFAKLELHEKALKLWEQAYEIPPHYLGGLYSRAFLFDRLEKYDEAIQEWNRILAALKDQWNYSEGERVDWPRREIERLKRKQAGQETRY